MIILAVDPGWWLDQPLFYWRSLVNSGLDVVIAFLDYSFFRFYFIGSDSAFD